MMEGLLHINPARHITVNNVLHFQKHLDISDLDCGKAIRTKGICSGEKGHSTSCWHAQLHADSCEHHYLLF